MVDGHPWRRPVCSSRHPSVEAPHAPISPHLSLSLSLSLSFSLAISISLSRSLFSSICMHLSVSLHVNPCLFLVIIYCFGPRKSHFVWSSIMLNFKFLKSDLSGMSSDSGRRTPTASSMFPAPPSSRSTSRPHLSSTATARPQGRQSPAFGNNNR